MPNPLIRWRFHDLLRIIIGSAYYMIADD